jgi:hypothetical protein
MSWDIRDQEFEAVQALPAPKRYEYFIKRAASHGELYGLRDEIGWVTAGPASVPGWGRSRRLGNRDGNVRTRRWHRTDGSSMSLGPLVFVRAVALGVVFRVWPVVLVLYRDIFVGSLTKLRFDGFFLWRSGF